MTERWLHDAQPGQIIRLQEPYYKLGGVPCLVIAETSTGISIRAADSPHEARHVRHYFWAESSDGPHPIDLLATSGHRLLDGRDLLDSIADHLNGFAPQGKASKHDVASFCGIKPSDVTGYLGGIRMKVWTAVKIARNASLGWEDLTEIYPRLTQ